MVELAKQQDGFLGVESARNEIGITVSYWKDIDSIKKWKQNSEHLLRKIKDEKNGTKNIKQEYLKLKGITDMINNNNEHTMAIRNAG